MNAEKNEDEASERTLSQDKPIIDEPSLEQKEEIGDQSAEIKEFDKKQGPNSNAPNPQAHATEHQQHEQERSFDEPIPPPPSYPPPTPPTPSVSSASRSPFRSLPMDTEDVTNNNNIKIPCDIDVDSTNNANAATAPVSSLTPDTSPTAAAAIIATTNDVSFSMSTEENGNEGGSRFQDINDDEDENDSHNDEDVEDNRDEDGILSFNSRNIPQQDDSPLYRGRLRSVSIAQILPDGLDLCYPSLDTDTSAAGAAGSLDEMEPLIKFQLGIESQGDGRESPPDGDEFEPFIRSILLSSSSQQETTTWKDHNAIGSAIAPPSAAAIRSTILTDWALPTGQYQTTVYRRTKLMHSKLRIHTPSRIK